MTGVPDDLAAHAAAVLTGTGITVDRAIELANHVAEPSSAAEYAIQDGGTQ